VKNRDVAAILKEIAFFMRLNGGSPSIAKRYHKAGEALLLWSEELPVSIDALAQIPNIRLSMAKEIMQIALTGGSALHQEMRNDYPSSLAELGELPGLTLKQIYLLYHRAGVCSLADLRLAVQKPKQILSIPGFGPGVLAGLRKTLYEYQPVPDGHGLPHSRKKNA